MADGNRIYPVDNLVMHHSDGPEFINASDLEVQDWFDNIGKSRGYAGIADSFHKHPSRDKSTFAMAHYALHKYTLDGNKYGWRLTPLMVDPFDNVAWHAGNWEVNQSSIGIETCGNYLYEHLDEKALMLVADYFRGHDQNIGGTLDVNPHNRYFNTACCGKIADQLPTLIDMINNPDVYNSKLWPAPKPEPETPVEPPKPTPPIVIVAPKPTIDNVVVTNPDLYYTPPKPREQPVNNLTLTPEVQQTFLTLFLQLVNDYKSRKFLLVSLFLFAEMYLAINKITVEWYIHVVSAVVLAVYIIANVKEKE